MEQKFRKKPLNSDLGLTLRIFEPKDLGKTPLKFRPRSEFKHFGPKIQEKALKFRPRPEFKIFAAKIQGKNA